MAQIAIRQHRECATLKLPFFIGRSFAYRSITALCLLLPFPLFSATCRVRDFGAKGDGSTKDTAAIQHAIDDCARRGGGVVTLAAGIYLSAPIVLKTNITLELENGATLLGSPDHADYPVKTEFRAPGRQSLVSATNAECSAM